MSGRFIDNGDGTFTVSKPYFTAVNVLGEMYSIYDVKQDALPEGSDGCTDETVSEIAVNDYADEMSLKDDERRRNGVKSNLEKQLKKIKRHEIIHDFLFESGLAECSDWAQNEEMVDWFAIQWPKLQKAFQEAGVV